MILWKLMSTSETNSSRQVRCSSDRGMSTGKTLRIITIPSCLFIRLSPMPLSSAFRNYNKKMGSVQSTQLHYLSIKQLFPFASYLYDSFYLGPHVYSNPICWICFCSNSKTQGQIHNHKSVFQISFSLFLYLVPNIQSLARIDKVLE